MNSPFKYLKLIYKNVKLKSEEDLKNFNLYLINRFYYYNNKEKICNIINLFYNLPRSFQYNFFRLFFKKNYFRNGYLKKEKDDFYNDLNVKLIIDYLQKEYNVSLKVAKEYFNLLKEEDKNKILNMYNNTML